MSDKRVSKADFAEMCNTTTKQVARWCNEDYFSELEKMGYKKRQKLFTPRQFSFLSQNIIEFER